MQTPEGHVSLGGAAPINSTLGIGSLNADDVMDGTEYVVRESLKNSSGCGCLLLYSCIVRNFVLGYDNGAEIEKVQSCGGNEIPYLFAYSGGEICPVYTQGGQLVNRFHNMRAVSCIF
jgi:hypothetical protein